MTNLQKIRSQSCNAGMTRYHTVTWSTLLTVSLTQTQSVQ